MIAAVRATDWLDGLPPLRGTVSRNADLAKFTWFHVGGTAQVMFRAADVEDLRAFLGAKPEEVPVTVIGVASNLLVRDGGVPGVVIRLDRGFAGISIDENTVRAGAAALDIVVSRNARDAGLTGLEFLSGVPGTIGGALRMNAGAYGREIKDVLVAAEAAAPDGALHRLSNSEMGFSYRHSGVSEDWIFVAAYLRGEPGNATEIAQRMSRIGSARKESQPMRARTGGSTFTNPPGGKAWELIDAAGCRGMRRGGAMMSEVHCNFLINTGNATAEDLEQLAEDVRQRVREDSGVDLQWEIRRVGIPAPHTAGGRR
jgi:UDP-N-acetylmuramate dehydrogenase